MNLEAVANPQGLRLETVSFSQMPLQSELFLGFLDPSFPYTSNFWPNRDIPLTDFAGTALERYETDRDELCDALLSENKGYGASTKTLGNIERLRREDGVAVITGQQAGLFTGPAYTVYKALSAVRIATDLCRKGLNAVPVFWIASEDHDFEEISIASFRRADGGIWNAKISAENSELGKPVGDIQIPARIADVLKSLSAELGVTRFSEETHAALKSSYRRGASLSSAFGRLMTVLLGRYGIVFVNPMNPGIRRLSAPIAAEAVERSNDVRNALYEQNQLLLDKGFHCQVKVEDGFLPLFAISAEGKRKSLIEDLGSGLIRAKGQSLEYTKPELLDLIRSAPESVSPNALLRPVIQDFVFPTVCYVGGAAEISYFAQNVSIYEVLERPVTPVRHRNGFTLLEPRHRRTLERYGLTVADLFRGFEAVLAVIADREADSQTVTLLDEISERFGTSLDELAERFTAKDPGLADSAEKRKKKILWHISALKQKFLRAEATRDSDMIRRLEDLFETAMPGGVLQERKLSFVDILYRNGPNSLDWVFEAVSTEGNEHKCLYL
ncbi:MAG: bacillithiol biosynthesis cysteine-adding enzyme BshC [Acidobacteriota bacterium]|nr:bacillithiol biosynthesis cysteine-adding enzyme BshC [Acidobacteriota bacterium]MDH3529090.1 bacillithiol biosynthesis cysteine-adding enzyme BshC [Acidobacteriota bacterium]